MLHRASRPFRILALATTLWPAGCTVVPELDATIPDALRDADYPALLPLDPSLFAVAAPREESEAIQREMEARRARLQRRAETLAAPVIDADTEARMRRGVPR